MKLEYRTATASDGAALQYVDVGSGRPLVFLGGFRESIATSLATLERLSARFRVVSFDYRGFGETPGTENACVPRSTLDLNELLTRLDLTDVALVGYSMGGTTAFDYFARFGGERIGRAVFAGVSPRLLNDADWNLGLFQGRYVRADFDRDLAAILETPELFRIPFFLRASTPDLANPALVWPAPDDLDGWYAEAARRTRLRLPLLKRVFRLGTSPEQLRLERRYWETMGAADYRAVLPKIDVPAAALYAVPGSLYARATAEYTASRIPNAVAIPVENATHATLPKERFAEFADAIADFCARS